MNRRNTVNANTDQSRAPARRRSGSFFAPFEPTARDLGLHTAQKHDGKAPLAQDAGSEKDPS